MTDVLWLAAHLARPVEPDRIHRWAGAVEAALSVRVAGLERTERLGRHLILISWHDPVQAPRTWRQVEADAGGLALNDGFPIGFERLGLADPGPLAVAAAVAADPDLADRLHPPFANVAFAAGRLTIALDPLGFGAVYRAAGGGVTAWSSSPALASLFTYGALEASDEGWVGILSHARFLGDGSPLAGVVRAEPGTSVVADDRPDGLRTAQRDPVGRLFAADPDPDIPAAVDRAIRTVYASIRRLDPGALTVALSGGRDSRVLAAIALATGSVDAFWTSAPPELDIRVARDLIDRLDQPVPWSTRDKSAQLRSRDEMLAASGPSDVWDRAVRQQLLTEGHAEVTPQSRPPDPRPRLGEVRLWGIGGEFARAFYYDGSALADPAARVAAFWRGQGIGPRLVDAEARAQLLEPRIDAIARSYAERGIAGLHQLDAFYVFERIRRLTGRTRPTSGIWPYFTFDYAGSVLAQRPEQRATTRYYEEVVARVQPAWAGIAYSHELKATNFEAATAASHGEAYWASPATAAVAGELGSLLRTDRIVDRVALASLVKAAGRADGKAVQRMRSLNQVMNYVSYLRHLEAVQRDFRAAGGSAAGEPAVGEPGAWASQGGEAPSVVPRRGQLPPPPRSWRRIAPFVRRAGRRARWLAGGVRRRILRVLRRR